MGLVIGLILAGTIWVVLLEAVGKGRLPDPLDAQSLADAAATWSQSQPDAYELHLEITGQYSGSAVFRCDAVGTTSAEFDPEELASVLPVQSIDELLQLMRQDLETVADPERPPTPGMLGPGRGHVPMRASFDAEYGYPQRYQRPRIDELPPLEWVAIRFQAE